MLAYNLPLILVVLAACMGLGVTALALVSSMAPGWREERLLALIGGSAALFSVFDVVTDLCARRIDAHARDVWATFCFEPFYTTKSLGKGAGLGLAVSAGLVQAMRGTLTFDSSRGAGAEAFRSLLSGPEASEEPASDLTIPPFRQRLLFVDDDDVVRRATKRTLSRAFDVVTAGGVQQALDTLAADSVDVIVCDVMMRDGGGGALYSELQRASPDLAQRMLFLRGGVSASHAQEFLAHQPQPVLTKPLELARLLQAVAELGPPPGSADNVGLSAVP